MTVVEERPAPSVDIEEVAQAVADALQTGEDSRWVIGDTLLGLGEKCPSLRTLGAMVGVSAAWLSITRSTARAFEPHERARDQKWQLHRLAAIAPDPIAILEEAIGKGWSTKDLEEVLRERGYLKTKRGRKLVPAVELEQMKLAVMKLKHWLGPDLHTVLSSAPQNFTQTELGEAQQEWTELVKLAEA